MTSGEKLKLNLGLSNVKSRISRVINLPFKTYYIWYDTARPGSSLHWSKIMGTQKVSTLKTGDGKELLFTPLVDIEDFNGSITNSYFILVDIAGKRLINPDLLESVTLDDLKNSMSDLTLKFRKDRNKTTGTENRVSKLIQVDYRNGNLMFRWLTEPTENEADPNRDIYNIDKIGNLSIDKSKTYELDIEILDFSQWLDTYPEGYVITSKDIKDILDVAFVKVWSSSPSFWWQGMAFRLTQLDGSIYPCKIPDKFWGKLHGKESLVDKHLGGLINQISFWANPMASMATKFLKSKGLL